MDEKNILGKNILFITAHPDDESYLCAGTIFRNNKLGGKTSLICASSGEKGYLQLQNKLTKEELISKRKKELENASKFLGISQLFIFNFPDGDLKSHKTEIIGKSLIITKKLSPDLIISFDKYGITGHEDHIAVSEVSSKISNKLKIPFFSITISPTISHKFKDIFKNRKRGDHYQENIKYLKPNIKITIDPEIKKKSLSFHITQLGNIDPFRGMPDFFIKEILKAEYFVSNIK